MHLEIGLLLAKILEDFRSLLETKVGGRRSDGAPRRQQSPLFCHLSSTFFGGRAFCRYPPQRQHSASQSEPLCFCILFSGTMLIRQAHLTKSCLHAECFNGPNISSVAA